MATLAKYSLGPGSSNSASATLPAASTRARTATRTLPVIVESAFSGTSGKTWSSTSPPLEDDPELVSEAVAELFDESAADLVSVRRMAGEGEAAGGLEISFMAGCAAELFSVSRLAEVEFDFALRETSALEGRSSRSGATARALVFLGAGDEDSTPRLRNLGNAMMETTTKTPTATGMT